MIYMDNAATTRVKEEVLEAMLPYFCEFYGNPSSVYSSGRNARKAIEKSRRSIAQYFDCDAREIYFTSGGCEADSWALMNSAYSGGKRRTIITTEIEHKAILNGVKRLRQQGFTIKYLPVDSTGHAAASELERLIDDDTALVSVMAANNEVGTLQDIDEMCQIAHAHGALFHTDAVQAVSAFDWHLHAQKIDMLSISGHKLHAPKGIGMLYVRDNMDLNSLIFGGSQERGRRGGTENVPGIVGLGKAIELIKENNQTIENTKSKLTERLENGILGTIPGSNLNGPDGSRRASGIVNIAFDGVDGEALLFNLDLKGVQVSAGSACTSGSLDASHVLMAMGKTRDEAHASIRFSLSEENTAEEVDTVIQIVCETVNRLRSTKRILSEV